MPTITSDLVQYLRQKATPVSGTANLSCYDFRRHIKQSFKYSNIVSPDIDSIRISDSDNNHFRDREISRRFGLYISESDKFALDPIETINILKLNPDMNFMRDCDSIISIKYKGVDKQIVYFIKDEDPVLEQLLVELADKLQDHVEEQIKPSEPAVSSAYWNNWYRIPGNLDHYQSVVDPAIINIFREQLATWDRSQTFTVLDVGGGYGRLAEKLLAEAAKEGIKIRYILLEPSKEQCAIAQKLCIKYPQLEIVQGTVKDFVDSNHPEKGKIHFAVSCGGPLNEQVVDRDNALENARMIHQVLTPGGKLVATGFSPVLLNAADFREQGWRVDNTIRTGPKVKDMKQCYTCTKSSPRPTATLSPASAKAKTATSFWGSLDSAFSRWTGIGAESMGSSTDEIPASTTPSSAQDRPAQPSEATPVMQGQHSAGAGCSRAPAWIPPEERRKPPSAFDPTLMTRSPLGSSTASAQSERPSFGFAPAPSRCSSDTYSW